MEMKFTASVVEAIECVLQLQRGLLRYFPKGSDLSSHDNSVSVPPPVWCNFSLFSFSRIKATPVKMTERVHRTTEHIGSWKLERKVEFYYWGHHVATVELIGHKSDGAFDKLDNGAFWAVTRLGYFQQFDGGHKLPTDWKEIELEVIGMSGHCME